MKRTYLSIAAIGAVALLGIGAAATPSPQAASQGRVVSQTQQQVPAAPALVAINETEKQRWDRLRGLKPRHRLLWDGKHRTCGDRAHKRLKLRRRANH